MIRQQRRRRERQWAKINVGDDCTKFIERENLFAMPQVIEFQAVKISKKRLKVRSVGVFENHRYGGHIELETTCEWVEGEFKMLSHKQVGVIPEGDLWEAEEIDDSSA
ncbi:MAG: hypothetical protein ACM3UY_01930 [Methanocella sp.]